MQFVLLINVAKCQQRFVHTREPFDILNFDVLTWKGNDDPPNCYYAISELGHWFGNLIFRD